MENKSDKRLMILEASERSGEVPKIAVRNGLSPTGFFLDPIRKFPAKATRRRFSARYKLRVLEQADGCEESGGVGALLRREGLYWSNLQTWRRQRAGRNAAGADSSQAGAQVQAGQSSGCIN